jgi:hypothetical protein
MRTLKIITILISLGAMNYGFAYTCEQEKAILQDIRDAIADHRDVLNNTNWKHAYADQLNGSNGGDLSASYLLLQASQQIFGAMPNCEKDTSKPENFKTLNKVSH